MRWGINTADGRRFRATCVCFLRCRISTAEVAYCFATRRFRSADGARRIYKTQMHWLSRAVGVHFTPEQLNCVVIQSGSELAALAFHWVFALRMLTVFTEISDTLFCFLYLLFSLDTNLFQVTIKLNTQNILSVVI